MSARYNFLLKSQDRRRELPEKVIIGQAETETITHVIFKLLGFLLFYREGLRVEANLHQDNIPFVPDLVQLDYELRPRLWVECGDCSVQKLDKLAVKAPEAELWVIKRSAAEAEHLLKGMAKGELRRNRYRVIGLDGDMVEELCGLLKQRNEVLWMHGEFEPPSMQFDFNGLWFDTAFQVWRF